MPSSHSEHDLFQPVCVLTGSVTGTVVIYHSTYMKNSVITKQDRRINGQFMLIGGVLSTHKTLHIWCGLSRVVLAYTVDTSALKCIQHSGYLFHPLDPLLFLICGDLLTHLQCDKFHLLTVDVNFLFFFYHLPHFHLHEMTCYLRQFDTVPCWLWASLDVGSGISRRNLPGLNILHARGPVQVFRFILPTPWEGRVARALWFQIILLLAHCHWLGSLSIP
jgi:hypothetical protein